MLVSGCDTVAEHTHERPWVRIPPAVFSSLLYSISSDSLISPSQRCKKKSDRLNSFDETTGHFHLGFHLRSLLMLLMSRLKPTSWFFPPRSISKKKFFRKKNSQNFRFFLFNGDEWVAILRKKLKETSSFFKKIIWPFFEVVKFVALNWVCQLQLISRSSRRPSSNPSLLSRVSSPVCMIFLKLHF